MTLHVTPECISSLKPNEIFVFDSNLAGMHGGVETIRPYVDEFIDYAKQHPDLAAEWMEGDYRWCSSKSEINKCCNFAVKSLLMR